MNVRTNERTKNGRALLTLSCASICCAHLRIYWYIKVCFARCSYYPLFCWCFCCYYCSVCVQFILAHVITIFCVYILTLKAIFAASLDKRLCQFYPHTHTHTQKRREKELPLSLSIHILFPGISFYAICFFPIRARKSNLCSETKLNSAYINTHTHIYIRTHFVVVAWWCFWMEIHAASNSRLYAMRINAPQMQNRIVDSQENGLHFLTENRYESQFFWHISQFIVWYMLGLKLIPKAW